MPTTIPLEIQLGAPLAANRRTIHRHDRIRISYPSAGPNVFTFKYTVAFPFETTESLSTPRPNGEEKEATIAGTFPFQCFLSGNLIPEAGELIVEAQ